VPGNTVRFRSRRFPLWKCPFCESLVSLDPFDGKDAYRDYPLNERKLDVFARRTLGNLLARLRRAGLEPSHRILDYGCGNGVFVRFLQERGYVHVEGYDPYVAKYSTPATGLFDFVVANDVIEHADDVRDLVGRCTELVAPGGILYLGTADSAPVGARELAREIMRLHQPYHRIIVTERALKGLALETGFELVASYRRSYMDTLLPFANYRFLDELHRVVGGTLEAMFGPEGVRSVLHHPRLWFFAFLGFFFPSAMEPAVIIRRRLDFEAQAG
jgi:SAM-dependent methyltransferase